MRDFEFFLDKLSELAGINITCYSRGMYWDLHTQTEFNPLKYSPALRETLIGMTRKNPQLPALVLDKNDVMFSAILWEDIPVYLPEGQTETDREAERDADAQQNLPWKAEEDSDTWAWFLIGPAALHSMNVVGLHRYYRTYTNDVLTEKHPPVQSFTRFLSMVQVAAMTFGKRADEEDIIRYSGLDAGISARLAVDQTLFSLRQEEEEAAHHTYAEEQVLLGHVREGHADEALHHSMLLDQELGRMSLNQLLQWKKLVTVAVTLVSRAAIDGGLSPAQAYRLSDYYLQKSDDCPDIPSLIACRNQAVRDFCENVARQKQQKKHSIYVLQCCEYIQRHYREKILLQEIAAQLSINPTYLSRLFSREMNIRLQDYIVRFRVERAANLLKYSDETIARIGDYVGFPSQSHFGCTFRKITGLTPRQYRERYRNLT